tara:strand:- start:49 stop:180 length:132 start_codon:yes stop_codon:yes gene_type:complete
VGATLRGNTNPQAKDVTTLVSIVDTPLGEIPEADSGEGYGSLV